MVTDRESLKRFIFFFQHLQVEKKTDAQNPQCPPIFLVHSLRQTKKLNNKTTKAMELSGAGLCERFPSRWVLNRLCFHGWEGGKVVSSWTHHGHGEPWWNNLDYQGFGLVTVTLFFVVFFVEDLGFATWVGCVSIYDISSAGTWYCIRFDILWCFMILVSYLNSTYFRDFRDLQFSCFAFAGNHISTIILWLLFGLLSTPHSTISWIHRSEYLTKQIGRTI